MRPSRVRSKTAPQRSSSRTRSGASWAWMRAIFQLLSIFPPTIVSRKCVSQESLGATWASAAATPPSAMTVCALPSRDLQTRPTEAPCAAASMAARRPAPPAPTTSTSCGCRSMESITSGPSARSEADRGVDEDAEPEQADVEVGEDDRGQAQPGPAHVVLVEAGQRPPEPVTRPWHDAAGEAVELPADEVAQRVTRERVARQERDIDEHEQAAQAD